MTHPADQRRAELVEIVARAIYEKHWGSTIGTPDWGSIWLPVPVAEQWRAQATAAIDALTAAGVDLEGWREIESAPKDGTSILAYGRYDDQPVEVRWRHNDWMAVWNGYSVIESQGDTWTNYHFADPLSHWRPLLPLPPKDKSNG